MCLKSWIIWRNSSRVKDGFKPDIWLVGLSDYKCSKSLKTLSYLTGFLLLGCLVICFADVAICLSVHWLVMMEPCSNGPQSSRKSHTIRFYYNGNNIFWQLGTSTDVVSPSKSVIAMFYCSWLVGLSVFIEFHHFSLQFKRVKRHNEQ